MRQLHFLNLVGTRGSSAMDALRSGRCGEGTDAGLSAGTSGIHARILKVCLGQGLAASDAEDVAQEIFVWLSQTGRSEAADIPWVGAVAGNFVQRYIRRRAVRTARESRAAGEQAARPGRDGIEALESKLVLDKLEKNLPLNEAKLLHLIRRGCTFREAVRALDIPRGSWSYFERRLVGHLKEGLIPNPQRAAVGAGLGTAGGAAVGAAGAASLRRARR